MKKFIFALFAMALVAFPVVLTSCGDDEPDDPQELKPEYAKFESVIAVSPDIAKYIELEVKYTDVNGKTQTVKLPEQPVDYEGQQMYVISLSDTSKKLPAEVAFDCKVSRNDYPLEDGATTVSCAVSVVNKVTVYDKEGGIQSMRMTPYNSSNVVPVTYLDKYIESFGNSIKHTVISVDDKGEIDIE